MISQRAVAAMRHVAATKLACDRPPV